MALFYYPVRCVSATSKSIPVICLLLSSEDKSEMNIHKSQWMGPLYHTYMCWSNHYHYIPNKNFLYQCKYFVYQCVQLRTRSISSLRPSLAEYKCSNLWGHHHRPFDNGIFTFGIMEYKYEKYSNLALMGSIKLLTVKMTGFNHLKIHIPGASQTVEILIFHPPNPTVSILLYFLALTEQAPGLVTELHSICKWLLAKTMQVISA